MNEKQHKRTINRIFLAALCGLACWLALYMADSSVTAKGASFAGVFVMTLLLWSTVDIGWPTLLAACLLIVTGAADSSTPFSVVFGSSITVTMIAMAFITGVMQKSGLVSYLARWCLSRKVVHGKPYMFLVMYCVLLWILGSFASFALIGYLMVSFIGSICASCGYEKGSRLELSLLCLTLWIGSAMCGILPMAHPSSLQVIAIAQAAGYSVSYITWLSISVPFGVLITAAGIGIVRFVIRPDFGRLSSYDDAKIREELKAEQLSFGAKLSVICLVFIVLCWLIQSLNLGPLSRYLKTWGSATPCMLAFIALILIPDSDGRTVSDFRGAMREVPWSIVLMTGGITYFATHISAEQYGIQAALVQGLSPLLSAFGTTAVIVIGAAIACLASQFMSNTVSSMVVLVSIITAISGGRTLSNWQLHALLAGTWSLANCAYCTFAAAPAVGVIFNADSIPLKRALKYHVLAAAVFALLFAAEITVLATLAA